jgi:hypothetical protein
MIKVDHQDIIDNTIKLRSLQRLAALNALDDL